MMLAGRRIVIVGGAAGIGLATANLALASDAAVITVDRDPVADVQADVRDSAAVEAAMAAAAKRMGGWMASSTVPVPTCW